METVKVLTIMQSLLLIISSIISVRFSDNKIQMVILSVLNIFVIIVLYLVGQTINDE